MNTETLFCLSKFLTVGELHYLFIEVYNKGLGTIEVNNVRAVSITDTRISVLLTKIEGSSQCYEGLVLLPLEKFAQIYILRLKQNDDLQIKDTELYLQLVIDNTVKNEYGDFTENTILHDLPRLRIRKPSLSLLAVRGDHSPCFTGQRFSVLYKLINHLHEFCVTLEWKPELLSYGTQKYSDVVCHHPSTLVYHCKPGYVTLITVDFTVFTQNTIEFVAPLKASLQYKRIKNTDSGITNSRIQSSPHNSEIPITIFEDWDEDNSSITGELKNNNYSSVSAVKLTLGRICEHPLEIYAFHPKINFF